MSIAENNVYKVYTGDLTDYIYLAPSVLSGGIIDANWTCYQRVVDSSGTEIIAKTQVTTKSGDNTEFEVYLTPAQTANLTTAGDYGWYIQLENTTLTPVFTKETHLILRVSAQGIT